MQGQGLENFAEAYRLHELGSLPSSFLRGHLLNAGDLLEKPSISVVLTGHAAPELASFENLDLNLHLNIRPWSQNSLALQAMIENGLAANISTLKHRLLRPKLWQAKAMQEDLSKAAEFYAPIAQIFRDLAEAEIAKNPKLNPQKIIIECVHNKRSVKTKPSLHRDYSVLIAVAVAGCGKPVPAILQRGTYALLQENGKEQFYDIGWHGTGFWRGRGAAIFKNNEQLEGLPHSSPFFQKNETPISHEAQNRHMLSVMLTLKD